MRLILRVLLALCLLAPAGIWAESSNDLPVTRKPSDLQAVSFEDWDGVLEKQLGHITVVDFWAGWCSPCIERFPHMVEMHHQYKDRGVRFISLNLDEQGDEESIQWANDFLERIEAVFPNYHMNENMTAAFERLDLLGLPTVRIYATDGSEAYRLSGDNPYKQFTEKDVEDAVLKLLSQP
jgi:thiol-disulfide isomerase/thioredoxin